MDQMFKKVEVVKLKMLNSMKITQLEDQYHLSIFAIFAINFKTTGQDIVILVRVAWLNMIIIVVGLVLVLGNSIIDYIGGYSSLTS